jgi:endonuclease/exonuclease/phosphatase family metal-dependent hydrolase
VVAHRIPQQFFGQLAGALGMKPRTAILAAVVAVLLLPAFLPDAVTQKPDSLLLPQIHPARSGPGTLASSRVVAQQQPQLRVVSYNVHSCKGLDFRTQPGRIAAILRRTGADVAGLQEVREEQAAEIARRLGFHLAFVRADIVHGYKFGNAILSRFPIQATHTYPLGVPHRQQRACLQAEIAWPTNAQVVHVFVVHLGLKGEERRYQAERLASQEILADPAWQNAPRIFMGDLNEKGSNGAVNQNLAAVLQPAKRRTWPGLLPLLYLDRFYFGGDIRLRSLRLYRSGSALIASDHVPLVAVFEKK